LGKIISTLTAFNDTDTLKRNIMKTCKLILPLVLAMAALVATTGCKHGVTKTTNIPGMRQPPIAPPETDPNTAHPITFGGDTGTTSTPLPPGQIGGGATSEAWDPSKCDQDPAALAANTVHFKFDSYVVLDNEQANVAAVAQYMSANTKDYLLIEGHCDERGTEEYNRALGERRALALREALDKAGVAAARVRTISFGKDKPADTAHDEAAWAKNRRGAFVVCHPKM
jgi:peptidoglycan-associated lipoprotein